MLLINELYIPKRNRYGIFHLVVRDKWFSGSTSTACGWEIEKELIIKLEDLPKDLHLCKHCGYSTTLPVPGKIIWEWTQKEKASDAD